MLKLKASCETSRSKACKCQAPPHLRFYIKSCSLDVQDHISNVTPVLSSVFL